MIYLEAVTNYDDVTAHWQGEVHIKVLVNNKVDKIVMKSALFVSKMSNNLISVVKLTGLGFNLEYVDNHCHMKTKQNTIVTRVNNLYRLLLPSQEVCVAISTVKPESVPSSVWHM